jgi:hypothetical protein
MKNISLRKVSNGLFVSMLSRSRITIFTTSSANYGSFPLSLKLFPRVTIIVIIFIFIFTPFTTLAYISLLHPSIIYIIIIILFILYYIFSYLTLSLHQSLHYYHGKKIFFLSNLEINCIDTISYYHYS